MLKKGGINQKDQEIFSAINLGVGERDGGNHSLINLKNLNCFNPHQHFKKILYCLKFLLLENNFLSKIDLKDAYFSVPFQECSGKYCEILMVGKLLRLSLPVFWSRGSSKILRNFFEDSNCNSRKNEYKAYHIWTRFYRGEQILLQKLDFIINRKKIFFQIIHKLEFLGVVKNTSQLTLSQTRN